MEKKTDKKRRIIIKFPERISDFIQVWKSQPITLKKIKENKVSYRKINKELLLTLSRDSKKQTNFNVYQDDLLLGRLPIGKLRNRIYKTINDDNYMHIAKIYDVNEEDKEVIIQVVIYKKINSSDYQLLEELESNVEECCTTERQKNLENAIEEEKVQIVYKDNKCIIIDSSENEIGELDKNSFDALIKYNADECEIVSEIKEINGRKIGDYTATISIKVYKK